MYVSVNICHCIDILLFCGGINVPRSDLRVFYSPDNYYPLLSFAPITQPLQRLKPTDPALTFRQCERDTFSLRPGREARYEIRVQYRSDNGGVTPGGEYNIQVGSGRVL